MMSVLKRHIEKAIEAKIIETIGQADSKLTNKITKQYKAALAKDTSIQTLASEPQQHHASAVTNADKTLRQQRVERPERPGLFVALLTIMNRSVQSRVMSRMQDQQTKNRKKRLEKEKERREKEEEYFEQEQQRQWLLLQQQQQQLAAGAATNNNDKLGTSSKDMNLNGDASANKKNMVSVIVGKDGRTYIKKNNRLVPVNIVGGQDAGRSPMTTGQQGMTQDNRAMKNNSAFPSSKNYQENIIGNQDTNNSQQYPTSGMAPNIQRAQ